jgi:uncharacterized protein (TIGR02466 family)
MKETIFSTSIIHEIYKNSQLKKEILKELSIQEKDSEKIYRSNVGGFHSKDINNQYICQTLGNKVAQLISQNYKLHNKNMTLSNLWINKNKKGDFNKTHVHPNSHFSGVYYINCPRTRGELYLMNNHFSNSSINSFMEISKDFKVEYIIYPVNDLLVIFPSTLPHMACPHFEKIDRISVSFNIVLNSK